MGLLTLETLLSAAPPLKTEDVELPEFGGTVRVREWNGEAYDEWQLFVSSRKGQVQMVRAAAIASSLIDEEGKRLCDMNGHISKINAAWPASAIDRVWDVVSRLNKLGKEDVEDAEKN